jgi:2',3'-cyclic-nucleotide 2'-phosphodiesterase (5'-nucleotidase family)
MKRALQAGFLSCFLIVVSFQASADGPRTITILHTNDMHAQFIPKEALWVRQTPRPLVGGFARIKELVDSIRTVQPATLVLDAGDVMTGNPITDRAYRGAEGGALFAMMNMIGYDAWCPGNHDFDISQENLRGLIRILSFPTLSANLVNDKGDFPVGNRPYAIVERGGLRIGIIGLISPELYDLVNQNNLVGIRVLSTTETVQKYVAVLKGKTDLTILLTHQGVDLDSSLAEEISGVDVIVGGHSHTRLRAPKLVHGVIIVQAGSYAENLGELQLTVDNGRVVKYAGKLIPTWVTREPKPDALTVLADSMRAEIDQEYSEVIGQLSGEWKRSESQSAIGTFLADAQRRAAAADVGFMNNHGIRKDQPAGPMTKRDLFEILPFRNILTTFEMTGKQLSGVVRHMLDEHPAIQIAGVTAVYRREPDGTTAFREIRVGGKPLEEEKMYKCAASDFMVGEAKKYLGFEIPQPYYLQETVFEAVEKRIRELKNIDPKVLYAIEEQR